MGKHGTSMELASPTLCAVIVTYGARGAMAAEVASRLSTTPNLQLVIIHNGPTSPRLIGDAQGIHQIDLVENLGSAGGYAKGIRTALELSCEYILLLDDDNAPESDTLSKLFSQLTMMSKTLDPSLCAVLAFRKGRFRLTAKGYGRAASSAFLGLDLSAAASSLIAKLRTTPTADSSPSDPWPLADALPLCAYGGLLAHRSLFSRIGLPREEMVLYADDHEYTRRITALGGQIRLVRDAAVEDIDLADERRALKSGRGLLAKTVDRLNAKRDFRLFYATRNHVWLGLDLSRSNQFKFYLNAVAYVTLLTLMAALLWRWPNYALLIDAIEDGLARRGGVRPDFPLPNLPVAP